MLDRTWNFSTLLPINGVLLLPATVSNIGTHTINCTQYLKMHTAEQKIARNNEKNSTNGYKNCEHLSTNAHPPTYTYSMSVVIVRRSQSFYEHFGIYVCTYIHIVQWRCYQFTRIYFSNMEWYMSIYIRTYTQYSYI